MGNCAKRYKTPQYTSDEHLQKVHCEENRSEINQYTSSDSDFARELNEIRSLKQKQKNDNYGNANIIKNENIINEMVSRIIKKTIQCQ